MNKNKVLVVVCAYNEKEAIFNCLDSLRNSIDKNALYNSVSVVCVDNSSTDGTSEIASEFAKKNTNFNYVKIEHCNLCISRNTYKSFEGYDYVAYIDGDGYVSEEWTRTLMDLIEREPDVDIISGPVLDLESKGENLVWEMYFDSQLYNTDKYLIGANMIFSRKLLDEVDGFPSFFPVRGDETSLLLRVQKLKKQVNHVFCDNLIAYNFFPSDLRTFLKTQYADGKRSFDVSQLNGSYSKTRINGVVKLVSLALLLLTPLAAVLFSPMFSVVLFLASFAPYVLRHRKYVGNVLNKIRPPRLFHRLYYASIILLSRYLFDAGFLSRFIENKHVSSDMLNDTVNPIILEKNNG